MRREAETEKGVVYVVGVDIGGTFTDCIVVQAKPATRAAVGDEGAAIGKASSTPPDFHTGFIESMRAAAQGLGISLEELVSEADAIYHGCTVGTNALVESRTAKVGLLTTRGHRDTIFAMQAGGRLRNLPPEYIARVAMQDKPEPLVPKSLCADIDERIGFDGQVLVDLNEDQARAEVRRLVEAGVQSFAISLLWAPVNDAHERRLEELVASEAPDAFISRSSAVVPRVGEYQRGIATTVNALIGPEMDLYLLRLAGELEKLGSRSPLQVMTCTGGVIGAEMARAVPVLTIGSGPVAGLIGAGSLAKQTSTDGARINVITGDMGGTSFDVGVITDGVPLGRRTSNYGQYEYFVPTLDVRSIGAGGGSIIQFDRDARTLRVGPRSAGARPGPVCYQRGGIEPTVTDANLVLGCIDPDYFLGGSIKLDVAAARQALGAVGAPLGFTAEQTAAAAVQIVDSAMADVIRLASVQQGYDPREFSFYAFGGAGPLHSAAIARELGIRTVVIPLSDFAAGWSAFGIASSDVVVVKEVSVAFKHPFDPADLNVHWEALEDAVRSDMGRQAIPDNAVRLARTVEMRYAMQVNEVEVDAPAGLWAAEDVEALVREFEHSYERLYGEGSGYAAAGFAITGLRVHGSAAMSDFDLPHADRASDGNPPEKERRPVVWPKQGDAAVDTPIYDGLAFRPGMCVSGPAVVEYPDTTIVLRGGDEATIEPHGSVVVTLPQQA